MPPDADGYPGDADLRRIASWSNDEPHERMAYARSCWQYGDMDGWWTEEQAVDDMGHSAVRYRLATAGRKGNESVISALRVDRIFWMMHWQSSHRGGLYVFVIKLAVAEAPEVQDEP